MRDQATLLSQLKIERDESAPSPRSGRTALVVGAVAVAIAAAAFAAVRLVANPAEQLSSGVAAAEETAPPASPSPAAAPVASILDASGYVVARRQATVSAKITGKVVAVLIEEGQRVEAGEIIARLDDANARAQVAQATAQVEQQRATLTAAHVAFANAGLLWACGVGFVGALFPAVRAARLPLATALRAI